LDERGGAFVACWIEADRALFQGFAGCDTATSASEVIRTDASEFGSPVTMTASGTHARFTIRRIQPVELDILRGTQAADAECNGLTLPHGSIFLLTHLRYWR
jgi:hypothetical protein